MHASPSGPRPTLRARLQRWPPVLRLRDIILYSDLEFSELGTAWAALSTGCWIIAPWTDHDPNHPVFSILTHIAPIHAWAGLTLFIGSVQLLGLAWARLPMRLAGSLMAFILWMFITLLFTGVYHTSFHTPAYATLALMAGWAHLRASFRQP
jgi:hypothetical protein